MPCLLRRNMSDSILHLCPPFLPPLFPQLKSELCINYHIILMMSPFEGCLKDILQNLKAMGGEL